MKAFFATKWILMVWLVTGCLKTVSAAENDYASTERTIFELGQCKITVLGLYAWRDWQPVVERPGPEGGSPLYVKVKLRVANQGTGTDTLSYRAVIIAEDGKSYEATFKILPNLGVMPDAAMESYGNLDDQGKKDMLAKYNVEWDGSLHSAEDRLVEIITHDGPYLPVASRIRVEINWTDAEGHSVVVRTPETNIERTD
jgi:hypothetical protein